jgi:hypothetical protein
LANKIPNNSVTDWNKDPERHYRDHGKGITGTQQIPAIMNPKREINPPRPDCHQAITSPQNAIIKQTVVVIPRMSGGMGAEPDGLWEPSRKKPIDPKRQITSQIVPKTRAARRIRLKGVLFFEIFVISFMIIMDHFKSKLVQNNG